MTSAMSRNQVVSFILSVVICLFLLLAGLYANNFNDLLEAEQTILGICDHPKTTPSQLSVALHELAHWQLQRGDPVAARSMGVPVDAVKVWLFVGTACAATLLCLAAFGAAIERLGIAGKTDLIVVSDHGFATIKLRIVLSEMLVSAGIKKSHDSTDVIVAPNGGADLIYLSPAEFPTLESRRTVLQRIVNFAEAQEWCGPIFSREAAIASAEPSRRGRSRRCRRAANSAAASGDCRADGVGEIHAD